jgi:hypothetical protein
MSFYRVQSAFTYRSITGAGKSYYYDVVISQNGQAEVRNIIGPYGPLGMSALPASVSAEIQQAITQSQATVMATSAFSGQVVFAAETSKIINIDPALANTNYRVLLDVPDFVLARVRMKSTTAFTIETGVTYTGTIGFEVFI